MHHDTILLVEDNAEEEALTLRAFRKNNIATPIRVVHDGVEALDFLFCRNAYANRDPHDLPRLILLDLKLPGMDGVAVLHHLRTDPRTCQLPVVILTSSQEEQDVIEGYQHGANSYVHKSVDFTQFLESIRQIGSYWLAWNAALVSNGMHDSGS